jgi:hypothetical protein
MTRVIAMVVAICVAGCGLTMTTGPDPRQPPDQRPVCTETMDAPKKDAIGAVVGLVAIVFGAVALDAGDNDTLGASLLIGGGALMIGSYVSGYVGYSRVKKCQKAIENFNYCAAGTGACRRASAP